MFTIVKRAMSGRSDMIFRRLGNRLCKGGVRGTVGHVRRGVLRAPTGPRARIGRVERGRVRGWTADLARPRTPGMRAPGRARGADRARPDRPLSVGTRARRARRSGGHPRRRIGATKRRRPCSRPTRASRKVGDSRPASTAPRDRTFRHEIERHAMGRQERRHHQPGPHEPGHHETDTTKTDGAA